MNRVIKFRVWNKNENKMREAKGIDFHYGEVTVEIASEKAKINGCGCCDDRTDTIFYLDDVILLEYTGLNDINGKEIFEGDIIGFTGFRTLYGEVSSKFDGEIDGFRGVIEYSKQYGWILNHSNKYNENNILKKKQGEKEDRCCIENYTNIDIIRKGVSPRIIGNQFKNSELLN